MPEELPQSDVTWKDFILLCIYGPLLVVQVVLVFLFYNYVRSTLLVYGGWVLLVAFFVVGFLPSYEFRKRGGVPKGRSYIYTTTVVDTGIYAVVRHPQFLSWVILSLALACMSQYWVSVICVVPVAVLVYMEAMRADKSNIKKFGDGYRKYMQKVPRLNPFVGIYRLLRRR
ncbi:MAG: isoprenylcysteine carboxylmethyltransferase family protein [Theionarchaea archaeon]|nr:isoprenylcysteine carboxylmethyltransferase family protein [Theionarchaea archaeon]